MPIRPVHAVLLSILLVVWAAVAAGRVLVGGDALAEWSSLPLTILVFGYGFLGILTMTVGLHVLKTHSGRRPPPAAWDLVEKIPLVAAIGIGWAYTITFHYEWLLAAGALFAASMLVHFGRTLHQGLIAPRERAAMDTLRGARTANVLHVTATAYAAAAGIQALRIGILAPGTVHLFFVGFLLGMVYAVLNRVLPRFAQRPLPRIGHGLTLAAGLFGPALVVYGLHSGNGTTLFAGAILETLGVVAAMALAGAAYRARRNPQPFAPFVLAALLLLLWGMTLGAHIGTGVSSYTLVPMHAVNNVVGAFGLLVLGMGRFMLGTGQVRTREGMLDLATPLGFAWIVAIVSWEIAAAWFPAARPLSDLLLAAVVFVHGVLILQTVRPNLAPAPPRPRPQSTGR